MPGFASPGSRTLGCLLIHGFTGSPAEMRPLGDALAAGGFPVRGVRVAGHGTEVADLVGTSWADWYASVDAEADRLRAETGRPIAVAGMSAGGLLALHLAARRPADVAALVLCGTPLAFDDRRLRWIPLLAALPWLPARWRMLPKAAGPDVADPVARVASPSYRATPLVGIAELLKLQVAVRAEIGSVAQPALVFHGAHDHTVPVANLERLREALGSSWIEAHVLPRSWHVVTIDVDRDELARLAVDFLSRVESASAPRARVAD